MTRNGTSPVEIFVTRIETARVIIDDSSKLLFNQLTGNKNKVEAIQAFFTRVHAIADLLHESLTAIETIKCKLERGNYNAMLDKVRGFEERIKKVITDCTTLTNSSLEDDFVLMNRNLISDVKIAIHHIETHGIDFILKNVKIKICKQQ